MFEVLFDSKDSKEFDKNLNILFDSLISFSKKVEETIRLLVNTPLKDLPE